MVPLDFLGPGVRSFVGAEPGVLGMAVESTRNACPATRWSLRAEALVLGFVSTDFEIPRTTFSGLPIF